MDLRPRQRPLFFGFTETEVSSDQVQNKEFCQKIARRFNSSSGRAGKPIVKWAEIQNWFIARQQDSTLKSESVIPESCPQSKENESPQILTEEEKVQISDKALEEFEARSSKDGAWYDVAMFLTHRFLDTGECEARVRFVGYGAEEDEWVNMKSVRKRSIPLENSECAILRVGDLVLCFQVRSDQAIYYDAHIIEIERKVHDIRGCRCRFTVRYDHDNTEEKVRLRRICHIPCDNSNIKDVA